jgi:uncharacterized membrane protein
MDGLLFMDAEISPHRSLSRRGFIVVIGLLTTINTGTALVFWRMGAAPVPVFLGIDVIAVIVAFVLSRHAGRARERIQVTTAEVRVLMQTAGGEARTVWTSPTAFTRVALSGVAGEETDLTLRLFGREFAVARALSRPERVDFAAALNAAIRQARTGRPAGP